MDGDRRRAKALAGPANPVIPDKLYFKIGEVAALLGVETYVLRFWQVEFSQLSPTKGGTGQRLYRRRDVETAIKIKRLLYNEGYTIPGARQMLKAELRERQPELPLMMNELHTNSFRLRRMRDELQEIAGILARPLPGTQRVPRPSRKSLHVLPGKGPQPVVEDEKPAVTDEAL